MGNNAIDATVKAEMISVLADAAVKDQKVLLSCASEWADGGC